MAGPSRTPHLSLQFSPYSIVGPSTMGTPQSAPSSRRSKAVPRPPNSWIIFRREMHELFKTDPDMKRLPQSKMSTYLSQMWKGMSEEDRSIYEYKANLAKEQHQRDFPDYQFRPRKREEKVREQEEKRQLREEKRKERVKERDTRKAKGKRKSSTPPSESQDGSPVQDRVEESSPSLPPAPVPRAVYSMGTFVDIYGLMDQLDNLSPPVSEAPSPFGSPCLPPMILGQNIMAPSPPQGSDAFSTEVPQNWDTPNQIDLPAQQQGQMHGYTQSDASPRSSPDDFASSAAFYAETGANNILSFDIDEISSIRYPSSVTLEDMLGALSVPNQAAINGEAWQGSTLSPEDVWYGMWSGLPDEDTSFSGRGQQRRQGW